MATRQLSNDGKKSRNEREWKRHKRDICGLAILRDCVTRLPQRLNSLYYCSTISLYINSQKKHDTHRGSLVAVATLSPFWRLVCHILIFRSVGQNAASPELKDIAQSIHSCLHISGQQGACELNFDIN